MAIKTLLETVNRKYLCYRSFLAEYTENRLLCICIFNFMKISGDKLPENMTTNICSENFRRN